MVSTFASTAIFILILTVLEGHTLVIPFFISIVESVVIVRSGFLRRLFLVGTLIRPERKVLRTLKLVVTSGVAMLERTIIKFFFFIFRFDSSFFFLFGVSIILVTTLIVFIRRRLFSKVRKRVITRVI